MKTVTKHGECYANISSSLTNCVSESRFLNSESCKICFLVVESSFDSLATPWTTIANELISLAHWLTLLAGYALTADASMLMRERDFNSNTLCKWDSVSAR